MTAEPGGELRRLRALVADLDAVVWEAEARSGRFTFVSERAETMLGHPPKAWLEDPSFWADHLHPDDRDDAVEDFLEGIAEGRPHDLEYRFLHADGSYVWLRDIGHVVPDANGSPLVVRGLLVDVTPHKLTEELRGDIEEQLRQTEERYRALIEQTPVVTYLDALGPENVTTYISPQVESLIGYSPDELTGSPPLWPSLLHPDDRDRVLEASDEAERLGGVFNIEYRLVARDGRVVWVHDQSVLIRDEEGTPLYWQGVWVDVTERRRAAELERALEFERGAAARLREVDEMKNTFLQAVSHDLRTPLAAILGIAVTLEQEGVVIADGEARQLAARIAANARRLDKMVNDLLDIDRLGRGIVEPALEEVDVVQLVTNLVRTSDTVRPRDVVLHTEPSIAEVDVAKVERIVENLLANAARHTPDGTRIWVGVRPMDGGVEISVEDDGPGIPAAMREEIFEAFRQGPNVPKHSPGVGVGLALVARFAELHRGRAWVEDRQGGGASFRVWLPAHPPMRERARPAGWIGGQATGSSA